MCSASWSIESRRSAVTTLGLKGQASALAGVFFLLPMATTRMSQASASPAPAGGPGSAASVGFATRQRTRECALLDAQVGDPLIDRRFGLGRIAPHPDLTRQLPGAGIDLDPICHPHCSRRALHATFKASSLSASRNPVSRFLISRSASAMMRSISSFTVGIS
jgi:hypothetical protein